jgi:hypothetical protein
MLRLFNVTLSPFVVVALLLGGFSTFLAYKGEYEAAMAGAGVAVAAATARTGKDEGSDELNRYREDLERYQKECTALKEEMNARDFTFTYKEQKLLNLIEREEEARRREGAVMREITELKRDIKVLHQLFDQQAKMKELELEIEKIKLREQFFVAHSSEALLLPESKLEAFELKLQKKQPIETSENFEEHPNE